jgi:hypothetical protein
MAVAAKLAHGKLLFDFAKAACVDGWTAIDDRVMGGVSQSRLRHDSGFAVFEGNVSLERNGVSAAMPALTMIPRASADERHSLMTCIIWPARGQFGWPT